MKDGTKDAWLIATLVLGLLATCAVANAQDLTPNLVGGQYHTTPPTATNGQLIGIQVDNRGVVQVNGTTSGTTTASISQTTPGSTNGVNINPTTASAAAITPIVSAAAESNHVICAAACNLWSAAVTTGAAAGFFMTFNATSAPADGAVTPIDCVQVPANGTASINFGSGPPDRYSTGVTLVFSTTGCFTKTASATAFFKGRGV